MRTFRVMILMGVVFLFTTGASIIDKETKTNVSELSHKVDRLVQLEQAWNAESARLLRGQRDTLQQLNNQMETLSLRIDSIKGQVDELKKAAPLIPQPVASLAVAPPPPPAPPPVALAPEPVLPTPVAPIVQQETSPEIVSLAPYLTSAISVILLTLLFFRMRRGEAELRKRLWKNEMNNLREELTYERPSANPKIHVTGEFGRGRLP